MLYAITPDDFLRSYGNADSKTLQEFLFNYCDRITEIEADGHELQYCCNILGRNLPPNRVYVFLGDNAKEIARNWEVVPYEP